LLDSGADPNIPENGWYPLDFANTKEMAQLLIDGGANNIGHTAGKRWLNNITPRTAVKVESLTLPSMPLLASSASARERPLPPPKLPLKTSGRSISFSEKFVPLRKEENPVQDQPQGQKDPEEKEQQQQDDSTPEQPSEDSPRILPQPPKPVQRRQSAPKPQAIPIKFTQSLPPKPLPPPTPLQRTHSSPLQHSSSTVQSSQSSQSVQSLQSSQSSPPPASPRSNERIIQRLQAQLLEKDEIIESLRRGQPSLSQDLRFWEDANQWAKVQLDPSSIIPSLSSIQLPKSRPTPPIPRERIHLEERVVSLGPCATIC